MEIVAKNRLGVEVTVVTDGNEQRLISEAALQVEDKVTFLIIEDIGYNQIVGVFEDKVPYIVERGEQPNRIIFQIAVPEGVGVVFQAE